MSKSTTETNYLNRIPQISPETIKVLVRDLKQKAKEGTLIVYLQKLRGDVFESNKGLEGLSDLEGKDWGYLKVLFMGGLLLMDYYLEN